MNPKPIPTLSDSLLRHRFAAWFATAGMIAVILGALGFEHLGGYIPCHLCLVQRQPYYAAIPIGALAILSASLGWPRNLARILLGSVGAAMLVAAAIGAYHAGVEWKWWEGPSECAAAAIAIPLDAGDLLADLSATQPPSCDDAALRIFGLSLAGWNVLLSGGLAALCFASASRRE